MSDVIEKQIAESEKRLRLAMLESNVIELNKLLAPELTFTNHLGHVLSKQDDIAAHESGTLNIEELNLSEEYIQLVEHAAIVTARAHLRGSYAGVESEADFRFTRIWSLSPEGVWQVAAAHSSLVA